MEIHHISFPPSKELIDQNTKKVLAIGDFDGVHLGHQDVIKHAVEIAAEHNLQSAIMTFKPHPREVLGQTKYSKYLAPLTKKLHLLEGLGIDHVFIVKFDQDFAKVSPEDFIEQMLFPLNIHTVVVGFDFTFGYKGLGTAETLKQLCKNNMDVNVIPPFNIDGEKVSSTLIREQLYLGKVDRLNEYLGRNYYISGRVVEGEKRGRQIGFPTANIEPNEPYVIPGKGVYAVRLNWRNRLYNGVMNIGVKPTFHDHEEAEPTLEVHILEFEENIYGEELKVEFVKFLRHEKKFSSAAQLISQIEKDIQHAKNTLKQKFV